MTTKKRKPMPIGIEDFKKLREKYYFVDKTRFIRELLDSHGDVTLITRPRRFGKTLTLSMLQYFFTMEQAEENRKLFEGLDIERAGEEYMREQGSRPVVFLTLKDVREWDFDSMISSLKENLRWLYGNFRYVIEGNRLSKDDKAFFQSILDKSVDVPSMQVALKNLLHVLELYHGHKPILLMDEYDAPIQAAWAHGYYEKCIGFMRNFLSAALKTNPSLDFAVLTGITRISKESIFSGLNNLKVCSVLAKQYSDIFGFTQTEAKRLMEDCGVGDKLTELKQWYDGYLFGDTEIYNPWSVIQFVGNDCTFAAYWFNTSGNSILRELLRDTDSSQETELIGLMRGEPIEAEINENIVYPEIYRNRDALYTMLLTTGYLKPFHLEPLHADSVSVSIPCQLVLPNREIRMAYHDEILNYLTRDTGKTILRQMLRAMLEGDAAGFQQRLQKILLNNISFHDARESFYHGMMLGFSVLLEGKFHVKSNGESGHGRFDLAFFPRKEGVPGIILEFKTVKDEELLESAAKEALAQIEAKQYGAELQQQGIREVWKYGIAFCKKRVWMEREA